MKSEKVKIGKYLTILAYFRLVNLHGCTPDPKSGASANSAISAYAPSAECLRGFLLLYYIRDNNYFQVFRVRSYKK